MRSTPIEKGVMKYGPWALFAVVALALIANAVPADSRPLTLAPAGESRQADPSPNVLRVLKTYDELMQANVEAVAAGGKFTERMQELEKRLAADVAGTQPELQALLATGNRERATAAAYALRHAPAPQPAVRSLVAALDRFDGALQNNICLALMFLLQAHPSVEVPLAPLVRTMAEKRWTSQQKAAQVVELMARQRKLADPDGSLAAVLIPMLASQRSRVYGPARSILPRVTGQSLGNDPIAWADWYRRKYGRRLDLAGSVYELLQIIRAERRGDKESFRVENDVYTSAAELLKRLKADTQTARQRGKVFALAVLLPAGSFPLDRVQGLMESLLPALPGVDVVFSPENEEFVPFTSALERLRRLSSSPASRSDSGNK
jgi:hypothetical protein